MWFHICTRRAKGVAPRLRAMIGGYEILLASFLVLVAEVLFYAALLFAGLPLVPARILRRGGWRLWQICCFSSRWRARC